jgi:uncharacterized delta-60 repeat protein
MKYLLLNCCLAISTFSFAQQPGDLDGDFDANGFVITSITDDYDSGESVVVQPDGKIVVTGTSGGNAAFSTDPTNISTVRYQTDGSLDNSFGTNGIVTTDLGFHETANAIALQVDGKIVVGGSSNAATGLDDFAIVRYNQDGTIDNTFTISQGGLFSGPAGICDAIAIQADGKIVAAGTAENASNDFIVARYNTDGTIDSSFAVNGLATTDFDGLNDNAHSMVIQADGKIVLAGNSDNGLDYDFAVARYNTDGSLDNDFSVNGMVTTDFGGTDDGSRSVLVQLDGKVVVVGLITTEPVQINIYALARFNTNGTLDNSFGVNGKVTPNFNGVSHSSVLQPDGKIIVAGGGLISFALLRFNTDGTLDDEFGVNGFVHEDIGPGRSLAKGCDLQPDGKIVVAGDASISGSGSNHGFAVARFITGLNLGVVSLSMQDNAMLIYPNPIQESAVLEYTLNHDEAISIELFDMSGKLVQSLVQSEKRTKGQQKETLVLDATLPSGNYILTLSNGVGSSSVRITK